MTCFIPLAHHLTISLASFTIAMMVVKLQQPTAPEKCRHTLDTFQYIITTRTITATTITTTTTTTINTSAHTINSIFYNSIEL
ncbi:MAG: hypothetical protein H0W19_04760 [Nitrosopumilus sp.]|nr:hypothetical protein [Nitrosopumilus sp.]